MIGQQRLKTNVWVCRTTQIAPCSPCDHPPTHPPFLLPSIHSSRVCPPVAQTASRSVWIGPTTDVVSAEEECCITSIVHSLSHSTSLTHACLFVRVMTHIPARCFAPSVPSIRAGSRPHVPPACTHHAFALFMNDGRTGMSSRCHTPCTTEICLRLGWDRAAEPAAQPSGDDAHLEYALTGQEGGIRTRSSDRVSFFWLSTLTVDLPQNCRSLFIAYDQAQFTPKRLAWTKHGERWMQFNSKISPTQGRREGL